MRQIICVNCESVLAMPSEAGVLKQCFCKETKVIREENRCFYCGPAIALMIDEHSLTVAARNLELNARN